MLLFFFFMSEEYPRDSKQFELATVNELSVFESLRFYCTTNVVLLSTSLIRPHWCINYFNDLICEQNA